MQTCQTGSVAWTPGSHDENLGGSGERVSAGADETVHLAGRRVRTSAWQSGCPGAAGRTCSVAARTGGRGPPGPCACRPILCQSDRDGKGDTHRRAHTPTAHTLHSHPARRAGTVNPAGTVHRSGTPRVRGPGRRATAGQPIVGWGCPEAPEDASVVPYMLRERPRAERKLILVNDRALG